MTDPDLGQLMRVVRASTGADSAQHFGIFGYRTADERDLVERRMRGKFGVKAVFYRVQVDGPEREDHSGLLDLLEFLKHSVRPQTQFGDPAPPIRSRTDGVRLEYFSSTPHGASQASIDPNKGQFGGMPEASGRLVHVANIREVVKDTYMSFAIVVKSLPGTPPLTGNILFYLHPTFGEKSEWNVLADHNICEIQINAAYGAFTVGIHIVKEDIKLELDLAEVEGFPLWFREN